MIAPSAPNDASTMPAAAAALNAVRRLCSIESDAVIERKMGTAAGASTTKSSVVIVESDQGLDGRRHRHFRGAGVVAVVDLDGAREGFAVSLYVKALGPDTPSAEREWAAALTSVVALLRSKDLNG